MSEAGKSNKTATIAAVAALVAIVAIGFAISKYRGGKAPTDEHGNPPAPPADVAAEFQRLGGSPTGPPAGGGTPGGVPISPGGPPMMPGGQPPSPGAPPITPGAPPGG